MRRVAVTGLGLVTPLGCGVDTVWPALISGKSGVTAIRSFDCTDWSCRIAGQVPLGDGPGDLNLDSVMPAKERRKIEPFILYALAAADEAVTDSGWSPESSDARNRTGVMVGSGIGGLNGIAQSALTLNERGPRRVSPFFIPSCLINLASGQISIKYGFRGPNHAPVTACSTGAHAIGDAARIIHYGDADVMIAGGSEGCVCPIGVAGFSAMRALSTHFNDAPEQASRPWDQDRDGFVISEGAGIVVLEDWEHAISRKAHIYAEVRGYGLSGDAYHVSAPAENGDGAYRSMRNALADAGLRPDQIDYINAHGTSTPLGDEIELKAVKRVFGDSIGTISISSTKSSIGHLLGAAGGVESIFSILAIRDGIVPPTLNLDHPSDGCAGFDLTPHQSRKRSVTFALSNSFGFGGTNASVVFGPAS